jgi:hypothetical protein
MSDQNEKDEVYQVDTVPPPEGEADAYNAPTRVGQMAASTIAEMLMVAGLDESAALDQAHSSAAPSASVGSGSPRGVEAAPQMYSSQLPEVHEQLNSSIPPSLGPIATRPPSLASSSDDGVQMTESGSIVPRLHEPEEDDDDPDLGLESEEVASFQPLSLTPTTPPVFTRIQTAMIFVVVVLAGVGIYLLFR